jgi:potassium/hydrogen antiporter
MHLPDRLPWELSARIGSEPTGAHKHRVEAGSPADGIALGDLPIGDDAWITQLVRDGEPCNPIQISSCGPTTGC